jgi:hypothetical protein
VIAEPLWTTVFVFSSGLAGYDLHVWTRITDRRERRRAQALSRAIGQLPPGTRRAMLEATHADELIVGAYTDRSGRMCPMLAAHRRGGRSQVGTFPRAWDSFGRAHRPRAATDRELEILKALLQESLAGEEPDVRHSDGAMAGASEPAQSGASGRQAR